MEGFNKVGKHLYKCTNCGELIESGISRIAGHWAKCDGKDFMSGLMKVAKEKNGKLTIEDINALNKQ
jgi:predicted  nucleic acid-binding Zn-ribbon protein